MVANTDACAVPVADLVAGDSPRLSGIDWAIVRGLVEVDGARLPPIVVDRDTMSVFDGLHRLAAAKLRGDRTILARFVDDQDVAFVEAVRNNASHGKPLTLGEKRAAAERILSCYPHWSDRKVAEISNLSNATVARIRACSSAGLGRLNRRIGRDGRERPVHAEEGRRRVAELLAEEPDATLRALAERAGVALATAKAVRDRIRRGEPVGPPRRPGSGSRGTRCEMSEREILAVLSRDPSLIQREPCRRFVQWLVISTVQRESIDELITRIPPHLVGLMAQLARTYVNTWSEVAARLGEIEREVEEFPPQWFRRTPA